jgi:hypothetical protein
MKQSKFTDSQIIEALKRVECGDKLHRLPEPDGFLLKSKTFSTEYSA